MSFRFTVVNIPSPARYWAAVFTINGTEYWPGVLRRDGEFQSYPVAGPVDFLAMGLYDSNRQLLPVEVGGVEYQKSIQYGVTVADGEDYQFDWQTNVFKSITGEPIFSSLRVALSTQFVRPGESFIATFSFDYSGPDMMGTGLKVALGTIIGAPNFGSFNEVQPVKVIQTAVYGPSNHYNRPVRFDVPLNMTPKTYDISCEIGDYPWSGHVYTKWRDFDQVQVYTGTEPPPDEVAPPPDEAEKGAFPWIPVALIAGGIIVAGSVMLPKK